MMWEDLVEDVAATYSQHYKYLDNTFRDRFPRRTMDTKRAMKSFLNEMKDSYPTFSKELKKAFRNFHRGNFYNFLDVILRLFTIEIYF